jgi:hypothetical protein
MTAERSVTYQDALQRSASHLNDADVSVKAVSAMIEAATKQQVAIMEDDIAIPLAVIGAVTDLGLAWAELAKAMK